MLISLQHLTLKHAVSDTWISRAMDIRKVRYFLRLCETLNFSQTAASLGLSQPALTKAVKRLEEEVGGVLIRREGKHTHLTSPISDD
jgi:DNA-binding MarR family transcriptional regulator